MTVAIDNTGISQRNTPVHNGECIDTTTSPTAKAIAIVDPVSSGAELKNYVIRAGQKLIALYTLSDEEWSKIPRPTTIKELSQGCDGSFHSKSAEKMSAYLRQLPFEVIAVIAGSESAVEMTDAVAEKLNLIGNSSSSSNRRRNKFIMRDTCKQNGLACPDFQLCQSAEQAIEFAKKHTFPVMVKTLQGTSAIDVYTCRSVDQVQTAFDRIVPGVNPFGQRSTHVLIEEHLNGPQYWVDILAIDGELYSIGLGISQVDENGSFVRDDYLIHPKDWRSLSHIVDYAFAVARAVGLRWGPAFVELRDVQGKGPVLVEVNSRLIGNGALLVLRGITAPDFDPFQATLDLYQDPSGYTMSPVVYHKYGTTYYMKPKVNGTVVAIQGLESIRRLPSYVAHTVAKNIGKKIRATDIVVYLHLASASREQIEVDILAADQALDVHVEK
ncbi:hypothetical protein H2198_002017 [Neophaeococcomyces mojaviensis]|uniref:Uncharacterized protein n=1 Tax=Neophaeococcomyces mojaviensis TaxID=3383035 RepID=A0ACC3AF74_9EURO|nr:hypothetical protein H2198_002017 [Knufia sp. JES_112]